MSRWTLRLVVAALLLAITAPVWAASQRRLPEAELTTPNTHVLDDEGEVVRGATPEKRVVQFPRNGVTDVLIIKAQTNGEVDAEIQALRKLGYGTERITHIPLKWRDMDLTEGCEMTVQALSKLLEIRQMENRRVYFHCTAGEDRTGMVAGLFRMLTQGWSFDRAFAEELCERGYAEGNPKKPTQVASAVRENLSPIYAGLALLIERGAVTSANLNVSVCSSSEFQGLMKNRQFRLKVAKLRCEK